MKNGLLNIRERIENAQRQLELAKNDDRSRYEHIKEVIKQLNYILDTIKEISLPIEK